MANEYLQRTPTSTGNRRVFTWAGWIKRNDINANGGNTYQGLFSVGTADGSEDTFVYSQDSIRLRCETGTDIQGSAKYRDVSSWAHVMMSVDTTLFEPDNRCIFYINGKKEDNMTDAGDIVRNALLRYNSIDMHYLGEFPRVNNHLDGQICDVFFVDGQALTPDVFGFYKQGKGYISAGSTQATDFRPGQWVPKTPRVIKTEINRRGGFGVNGFYLPMNDSNNFGADFHCDPNSIITLNEKLPQPRVGVANTASVGLGYTDVLRADPYAANLVLALPFVSSGLCTNGTNVGVNTGFGDYSHIIRNSGVAKTTELYGAVSMGNTGLYYGSSANFGGQGGDDYILTAASSDFVFSSNDFTIETWWFPTALGRQAIYHGSFGADYSIGIDFNGTDTNYRLGIWASSNGSNWNLANADAGGNGICGAGVTSNQWHHLAYERYGQNLTMYLNGVAVGIVTGITAAIDITATDKQAIGVWWNTTAMNEISGYLQDFRIYKGVAKYKGGFDVPRPYTPVGIATWRAVPDTTANNFATLNPLIGAGVNAGDTVPALLSGNLYLDNANQTWAPATIGVSTGKWYAEFMCLNGVQGSNIGVSGDSIAFRNSQDFFNKVGVSFVRLASSSITKQFTSTSFTSGSIGYTSGDIVGVTLDVTNKEIKFFKNNVGIFTDTTLSGFTTTNTHYYFTPFRTNDGSSGADWSDVVANFGQNPTFSGNTTAGTFTDSNGKGLFKYQPPSGFLALCEDNLPTPAISDPGKYFKTVLYTGTGASRNIVGVGFTPDLVWIKERNGTDNHRLVDSVRGASRELYSSLTNAEAIDSNGVLSFDSDGFSLGNSNSYNESGINHVAWCWRAGAGTTSTNTNGSITSVVSVNQDAGFSIVSYTGTGANATVGHGLNKKPKMVIVKRRDAVTNWPIWFEGVSTNTDQVLQLNLTNASASASTFFNSSNTTTTTFPLGSGGSQTNASGSPHIAYCWAEIEGFSKFGSYVGNGNADGPMVWCGFKPAWVMVKNASDTGGRDWGIQDSSRASTNPCNKQLKASQSEIENSGIADSTFEIDMLSNGFKVRNTTGIWNGSGNTIVFAAFAESPFTTANAK